MMPTITRMETMTIPATRPISTPSSSTANLLCAATVLSIKKFMLFSTLFVLNGFILSF